MPKLTVQRFVGEALAAAMYLLLAHCFTSVIWFGQRPRMEWTRRLDFLYPWTLDGTVKPQHHNLTASDVATNVVLMTIFAVQHSIMGRRTLQDKIIAVTGRFIERVLFWAFSWAALALALSQWHHSAQVIWHFPKDSLVGQTLDSLHNFGLFGTLFSLFVSWWHDEFDYRHAATGVHFCSHPIEILPIPYNIVRQPLFGSQLLGLFAGSHMTAGRLLFAVLMAIYTRIGVHFHERDMFRQQGEVFRLYKETVPMFVPFLTQFLVRALDSGHYEQWKVDRANLLLKLRCTDPHRDRKLS